MVIHKIKDTENKKIYPFTECNKALHLTGGLGSYTWERVTCKRCINKR